MKKKTIIIVALAAVIVAAVAVITSISSKKADTSKSEEYPKIVYVNGNTYYATDEKCDMVPRKMPEGKIETFIDSAIMPDMMDSANFGSEYGSMEYMFLDDGRLIVHMGEDWYYCDMPQ